jgi:Mn2+/Fe2+ NRAMP family transporter
MASSVANSERVAFDPYALPPDAIEEPPKSLWKALRKIGPGIILAGTIVGSGELILTTGLGAKNGFIFLWLILLSCVVKVFVQIELGRCAISTGKPTLGLLNDLPGRTPLGHPLVWWWFVMMLCTVFQLGAMTGGTAQALNLAFPKVSIAIAEQFSSFAPAVAADIAERPELPWSFLICLVTIALIYGGTYRRIEWLTTLIVVSVTLATVTAAVSLGWTEYPVKGADFIEGLKFRLPGTDTAVAIAAAFAVFGITGVGASECFYYPYWCLEKGYARATGRSDGSDAWAARAKGWIRVMHLDAWISMVVFTISTVSFYVMGAAVLHPQGLDPQPKDLIATLGEMFVGPFGAWTRTLFLVGAGAVLFKTLYLSCAANSRLTTDFLALCGLAKVETADDRARWIKRFTLVFPVLALLLYLGLRDPKAMVTIGGIAQATTLPMICLAAWYFRFKLIDRRLAPWPTTDVLLAIAVISVLVVAAYAVPDSIVKFVAFVRGKS